MVDDLAGWPLALHICRNAAPHGAANAAGGGDDDTVAGWIEMRLWRGLPVVDRDFVLDIALFDRVDPDLIDEVTGARNARRRLASMRALAGLVSTTGGDGSLMQLHPSIKGYCERRRFEETPERFRTIHCGIAQALARRGRVVEALRHTVAAGDTALARPDRGEHARRPAVARACAGCSGPVSPNHSSVSVSSSPSRTDAAAPPRSRCRRSLARRAGSPSGPG